ncbi:hypothetical protein [Mesorhizobium sp. LNJC403B00]|uniref:hypothetical protein n=1 Tax=Mesorhizobium sp. LNJC403B00 TaxID=1287280 RepID=UPI0003CE6BF2|nr:hypothetical protein [Mesorhizobium sp. LNJC403B00]ESX88276.1 hypothetical protein X754_27030 [Mesorhizobium sp. LNJC403B00]
MSNPWDRPPGPQTGDPDIETTYAAVGLVMSRWEEVELELCYLYAAFKGQGDDISVLREYGSGAIFNARKAILQSKAETYFRASPSQTNEGNFCRLITACEGFSARRNDIAHGVVRLTVFGGKDQPSLTQYALGPSFYDPRRFAPGEPRMTEYFYSSVELKRLAEQFAALEDRVSTFRVALFGH